MVTRPRLRRALAALGRAAARAHRDGIGRRASALAYATLVSIVPLLAVVSIFVAQTLREDDGRILQMIAELLPYREETVVEALRSFVAQAGSVSRLALVGFLVTSLATFFAVQETLFSVFRVTAPPSLARRIVTFTLLLFWGPVLIGSVYAVLLWIGRTTGTIGLLLRAVPVVVTFVGVAMLYWRAAYGRIRLRHAAAGSLLATVLIELLKGGFTVYTSTFSVVQRAVYGSFVIAFFFLLSVQLAWWILLYGAEVAATLARPQGDAEHDEERPDPWIALAALEQLGSAGRPALSTDELADRVAVSPASLRRHLAPLSHQGLLEAPLTHSGLWRLAVAPGRVRLESVFAASEPARPVSGVVDEEAAAPSHLERLRALLAGARVEALAGATLDDWLTRDLPRPPAPVAPPLAAAPEAAPGGPEPRAQEPVPPPDDSASPA